jgi:hypothetical protein
MLCGLAATLPLPVLVRHKVIVSYANLNFFLFKTRAEMAGMLSTNSDTAGSRLRETLQACPAQTFEWAMSS